MTHRTLKTAAIRQMIAALTIVTLLLTCSEEPGYFGQRPPEIEPTPFAPEILTAEKHPHGALSFSPDEAELFFSAFVTAGPTQTLYHATFDGANLSKPRVPFFTTTSADGGPVLSADGRTLFFSSARPVDTMDTIPVYRIWSVRRTATGWAEPYPIRSTLSWAEISTQISVARNGNLYFSAAANGDQWPDIYISRFEDGDYADPERLPGKVNTDLIEGDVFVDPDERFILFGSRWRDDEIGNGDLYISRRKFDNTWGTPQIITGVSTANVERFPSMSPDGKYLFFVRAIGNSYNTDDTHFYWVKSDVLGEIAH